ncbi:hypothetical protein AAC387_Pa07g0436 [Persea americana]
MGTGDTPKAFSGNDNEAAAKPFFPFLVLFFSSLPCSGSAPREQPLPLLPVSDDSESIESWIFYLQVKLSSLFFDSNQSKSRSS